MGYLLAIIWGALLATSIYTASNCDKAKIAHKLLREAEIDILCDALDDLEARVEVLEAGKVPSRKTVAKV